MNAPLPPEITVSETPDGIEYRLPPRDMRAARPLFGCCLIVGLGIVAIPTISAVVLFVTGGFTWIVGVIAAAVALVFVGLPWAAYAFLRGRSEIAIHDTELIATERGGILRWRRQRPIAGVRSLTVRLSSSGNPTTGSKVSDTANPASPQLGCIDVCVASQSSMWLAPMYPLTILQPLAEELNRRLAIPVSETAPGVELPPVAVEASDAPVARDRLEKPANSPAVLESRTDGVTITIPPVGLWRGSSGLFFFALVWNAIIAIITFCLLVAIASGNAQGDLWAPLLFLIPFWLIGIGVGLAAYHMGRRHAVFAVVGDTFMVIQQGPLGTKRGEWNCDDLTDIGTGPSGMEVNDQPVIELQIQPKTGKKIGLLAGRDTAELEWIATMLRHSLRLGSGSPPE
jgi:hypothetical protein